MKIRQLAKYSLSVIGLTACMGDGAELGASSSQELGHTSGTTVFDDGRGERLVPANEARMALVTGGEGLNLALLPGPVPAELHVSSGGLEWVWASPCNGGCSQPLPTNQVGYRFATLHELLTKAPSCQQFLRPDDSIKCASEYFDPVYSHCDLSDCMIGAVSSEHFGVGMWGQVDGNAESWYVRDDQDGDGVPDGDDLCDKTLIPEGSVPSQGLGINRWALADGDLEFDTTNPSGQGPSRSYSIADTGGCSCEQIINVCGYGNGHIKFGCSISVMDAAADGDGNLCEDQ